MESGPLAPALTIHIEMLPAEAFYFLGKEPGAGGLPTGTGGRVAACCRAVSTRPSRRTG